MLLVVYCGLRGKSWGHRAQGRQHSIAPHLSPLWTRGSAHRPARPAPSRRFVQLKAPPPGSRAEGRARDTSARGRHASAPTGLISWPSGASLRL